MTPLLTRRLLVPIAALALPPVDASQNLRLIALGILVALPVHDWAREFPFRAFVAVTQAVAA